MIPQYIIDKMRVLFALRRDDKPDMVEEEVLADWAEENNLHGLAVGLRNGKAEPCLQGFLLLTLREDDSLLTIESKGDYPIIYYRDYAGKPHRMDGPAIISSKHHRVYHFHGNKHRLDGPAAFGGDSGSAGAYYYMGKEPTPEQLAEIKRLENLRKEKEKEKNK